MYSCFVTFQFCYYSQLLPILRILSAIKIPKTIDYRVGKNEETVADIDCRSYLMVIAIKAGHVYIYKFNLHICKAIYT